MDFVAIDFETANSARTSPCSVGIAIVNNNKIVDSNFFLIKPEPLYFHPFNVKIHGITENDVRNAPTFNELWETLEPIISNELIVAHNASFDISVLRRTLELYNIMLPNINFLCTYRLAQSAFPGSGSYRLNNISKMLNINLNHHNAESDAIACAQILNSLMNKNNLHTLNEVESFYSMSHSYLTRYSDYATCKCNKKTCTCTKKKSAKDFININSDYIDDDFNGKYFVFTGTLLSMTRSKAFEIVATGGGIPQNSITKKTNYLVVGLQDYRVLNGGMSSKMKKAYENKNQGQDIQIIVEDEFVTMIDDELYSKCGLAAV